jgi:hypothetical protein
VRQLVFVSFAFFLAPVLHAQTCAPGQTFFKNDVLPANPGQSSVSVIQGLCEGEACGCVFDVSSVGSQVKVESAAVGYMQAGGVNGTQALVNLQIYDGVTFPGGVPQLGPLVFDFEAATQGDIGVTSSAINTVDLSGFDITVTSGKLVIAWVMEFNPIGTCAAGYAANFATDYPSGLANCNVHQKNLIDLQGQGWQDASTATVSGFPLCPIYYAGNWLIRACVQPGGSSTAPFCAGDGSLATACPCGNNGLVGHGCENSAATGGALLSATGSTSPDTMVLTSSSELPSVLSIFLQGSANLTSGAVFGDGVRCVNSNLKRLFTHNASGGSVSAPSGSDLSITARSAALGDTIAPGSLRYYQTYYRDPVLSFCANPPGNSWNVSSGIQIQW